jgi:hypothetical protein
VSFYLFFCESDVKVSRKKISLPLSYDEPRVFSQPLGQSRFSNSVLLEKLYTFKLKTAYHKSF